MLQCCIHCCCCRYRLEPFVGNPKREADHAAFFEPVANEVVLSTRRAPVTTRSVPVTTFDYPESTCRVPLTTQITRRVPAEYPWMDYAIARPTMLRSAVEPVANGDGRSAVFVAARRNAKQCHAMQCNGLQCNAMACNAMQRHAAALSSTRNEPCSVVPRALQ